MLRILNVFWFMKALDLRTEAIVYVSHVSDSGQREPVSAHLQEVAEMAAGFAECFGAQDWARTAGVAHDIGKYSDAFQLRILNNGHRCDHSTAGAYQLFEEGNAKLLAYCVAGHHGGLPDGGSRFDVNDEPTLWARMKKAEDGRLPDYKDFASEVEIPSAGRIVFPSQKAQDNFSLSFLTRMVFSCLVDADFLCTERFMKGQGRLSLSNDSLEELRDTFEAKLTAFYPPETELNKTRCSLLDACAEASAEEPGVFSLTVPTGGGKTCASMRFALQHACCGNHGMRRVIYAVPYTSIIEQNAAVFRDYLGDANVLEHHANFDFDDTEETGKALRLATENWDMPIVVTTNVQLFESLYSNKTSRCRKLHNIAKSVIVLDEAQMIPTKQLEPCIRSLAELVLLYGCTVVLCTATQPSLAPFFKKYGCPVHEIAPDPKGLYKRLKRVDYLYEGDVPDRDLAEKLLSYDQVLCVVNSRKQARSLYDLMAHHGKETDEAEGSNSNGAFHLSTLMHPVHRKKVLDEVRRRLKEGKTCRVVATSLIEAGVDVDFPVAFRALAGVDSVVQCAGRCNREGRHSANESIVHVFRPEDSYRLPSDIDQKAAITWSIINQMDTDEEGDERNSHFDGEFDFGSLDVIEAYFSQLHEAREGNLDADRVLSDLTLFPCDTWRGERVPLIPFKDTALRFRMIEEGSRSVVVPDDKIEAEVEQLQSGYSSRDTMRRISRYTVCLYDNDIMSLRKSGALRLLDDDTFLLLDKDLYQEDIGLNVPDVGGRALFS